MYCAGLVAYVGRELAPAIVRVRIDCGFKGRTGDGWNVIFTQQNAEHQI
jgi:hypothetical protein